MKEGSSPAAVSASASMDDVVVLPWVPATAIVCLLLQMAASISARLRTTRPASSAARISTLESGTAVDLQMRDAFPMLLAS